MNGRNQRMPTPRSQHALVHRGPQATSGLTGALPHAPNAALLIDFDNVTMGIRSDLGKELRSLLSSDIIKGKVAVQRAYADWRRYPQYIVPLSEASIDLIFAPAYGSSKKNATDIRLAIDALELVFTRPEIGTFILLSGDSDFSSLVIKLKEYGKYVIGVGIRESSSDLLVQNCDEYYSYNALAGLVKANEDEPARKFDPWELVTEAVTRMKRNGDVMRSDRLKQVMQEIDSTFDEKNLGISKFSRFCQEAAAKGLLSVTKLENGQLEIDIPSQAAAPEARAAAAPPREEEEAAPSEEPATAEEGSRRRGRRGRGRSRGREEWSGGREGREARDGREAREGRDQQDGRQQREEQEQAPRDREAARERPAALELTTEPRGGAEGIGVNGERLTRNEAFDIVRRAVDALLPDDGTARASDVRERARQLLGRDSESLSERMFVRILKDAHDQGIIDLRRRGDDFEVARAADAEPVAAQLARAEAKATPTPAAPLSPSAATPRVGMGPRGAGGRSRREPPPELFSVGVIEEPLAAAPAERPSEVAREEATAPASKRSRRGGRKSAKKGGAKKVSAAAPVDTAADLPAPTVADQAPDEEGGGRPRRGRAAGKKPRRARGKKTALAVEESEG
jgi:uncharacterized protein (TIGR00288 family)